MYRRAYKAMQVVSFSEARQSFKAVLDRVEADADVTLITRRDASSAVLMSLETYNSLMRRCTCCAVQPTPPTCSTPSSKPIAGS